MQQDVRDFLRYLIVGFIILLLGIPAGMVSSKVKERKRRYEEVLNNIAQGWGTWQTLGGPILSIPVWKRIPVEKVVDGKIKTSWMRQEEKAILLPDRVDIQGKISHEFRHRGIYYIPVFKATVKMDGNFTNLQDRVKSLFPPDRIEKVLWEKMRIHIFLSDPKGIVAIHSFTVNQQKVKAEPGASLSTEPTEAFHAVVGEISEESLDFQVDFTFRGMKDLLVLPLGGETTVSLQGSWLSPSFQGNILAEKYEINSKGFTAQWSISKISRSYPQEFLDGKRVDLQEIRAGVELFEPVSLYTIVDRAQKYRYLFIVLTFLLILLAEVTAGTKISLMQYCLVGLSFIVFFLTVLAFSEHIGFSLAYLLGAGATVILNTLYAWAYMPKKPYAWILAALLTVLYGILYFILHAEDYALLAGSVLIFAALSLAMYMTRKLHRWKVP